MAMGAVNVESTRLDEAFIGAVTVGERGQVVIPAEAREAMGLEAGDKLLAFLHPTGQMISLCRLSVLEQVTEFVSRVQLDQKAENEDDDADDDE